MQTEGAELLHGDTTSRFQIQGQSENQVTWLWDGSRDRKRE